jgi:hypothetical protein
VILLRWFRLGSIATEAGFGNADLQIINLNSTGRLSKCVKESRVSQDCGNRDRDGSGSS